MPVLLPDDVSIEQLLNEPKKAAIVTILPGYYAVSKGEKRKVNEKLAIAGRWKEEKDEEEKEKENKREKKQKYKKKDVKVVNENKEKEEKEIEEEEEEKEEKKTSIIKEAKAEGEAEAEIDSCTEGEKKKKKKRIVTEQDVCNALLPFCRLFRMRRIRTKEELQELVNIREREKQKNGLRNTAYTTTSRSGSKHSSDNTDLADENIPLSTRFLVCFSTRRHVLLLNACHDTEQISVVPIFPQPKSIEGSG